MNSRFALVFIVFLSACYLPEYEKHTLLFPNNHWQFKNHTNTKDVWHKGSGSICEGYDTIETSTDTLFCKTLFTVSDLNKLKSAHLKISLQANYSVFLNGRNLCEISNLPLAKDTLSYKSIAKAHRNIEKEFTKKIKFKPDEWLNEGINEIEFKITSVQICIDFQEVIAIRALKQKMIPSKDTTSIRLPKIRIDTDNQSIVDEPKIPAWLTAEWDTNIVQSAIGIEIRGTTSQVHPKKSYGFETQDSSGSNNNISLLGMPRENDWVLYGPYADKSLIRNVLAYKLFGEMGHYSPRTRHCDLYLNDKYEGIYILTEKIKRDKNRVNISKMDNSNSSSGDISGGYIISNDRADPEFSFPSLYYTNLPDLIYYHCVYPDSIANGNVKHKYIQHQFHKFESCFLNDSDRDYKDLIDVNSFADYLLLNELAKNVDAYRLSTYYYKDRDSINSKFFMGPIWDFNLAFGLGDSEKAYYFEDWIYEQNKHFIPFWWEKLTADEYFQDHLKKRWDELRKGIFSDNYLIGQIDSISYSLDPSLTKNFQRWKNLDHKVWSAYYNGPSYYDNVEYLKFWLVNRLKWMDENL